MLWRDFDQGSGPKWRLGGECQQDGAGASTEDLNILVLLYRADESGGS